MSKVEMEAVKGSIIKAAEGGDVVAQSNLGYMYLNGEGVEKNLDKAMYWLKEAAEGGDVPAQTNLGIVYLNGIGTSVNLTKGLYWVKQAAEAGGLVAQSTLGVLYIKGVGVEADFEQGINWIKKAAEAGDARSQGYLFGWMLMAAKEGDVAAQSTLGFMYLTGKGTEQDIEKGLQLIEESANAGSGNSRTYINYAYCDAVSKGMVFEQDISDWTLTCPAVQWPDAYA